MNENSLWQPTRFGNAKKPLLISFKMLYSKPKSKQKRRFKLNKKLGDQIPSFTIEKRTYVAGLCLQFKPSFLGGFWLGIWHFKELKQTFLGVTEPWRLSKWIFLRLAIKVGRVRSYVNDRDEGLDQLQQPLERKFTKATTQGSETEKKGLFKLFKMVPCMQKSEPKQPSIFDYKMADRTYVVVSLPVSAWLTHWRAAAAAVHCTVCYTVSSSLDHPHKILSQLILSVGSLVVSMSASHPASPSSNPGHILVQTFWTCWACDFSVSPSPFGLDLAGSCTGRPAGLVCSSHPMVSPQPSLSYVPTLRENRHYSDNMKKHFMWQQRSLVTRQKPWLHSVFCGFWQQQYLGLVQALPPQIVNLRMTITYPVIWAR